MRFAIIIIGTLLVIGLVAMLVGARLPREHVATVRARYTAAPEALWALIANPAAFPTWRGDVKSVEMLPGNGVTAWREHGTHGDIAFAITLRTEPTQLVTKITDESLPYGGGWEFTLSRSGAGTLLTITERGFVKPALFRLLSRYVFGYTASLESYHRALATKLGETVSPEIAASGH